DGQRLYEGLSGVWRSDDAGVHWTALTQPQPPSGQNSVPGALGFGFVRSLAVSQIDENLVLAAVAGDVHLNSQNGIYRSANGGHDWTLVHQFTCFGFFDQHPVGQIAFAPDNPNLVYAAGGCAIGISQD